MKKVTIALLALLAATVIGSPSVRDELYWRWTAYHDQVKDYARYLELWPDGHHSYEAKVRYEEKGWTEAIAANTVQAFDEYIREHPHGKYVTRARENIENLDWQEALSTNTVTSFQLHIDAHPSGRLVGEAISKKRALLQDDTPYLKAQKEGSRYAYLIFLSHFPGHKREAEARAALKEMEDREKGRDIVDLLTENKIEVKTRGNGIESVSLEIRRLVNYDFTVLIPVGTFFVSRNPSTQNMVTTQQVISALMDSGWVSVNVPVACTNRTRAIPFGEDSFTIQRSPQTKELEKLLPALQRARIESAVQQAAVWIVTDNPTYGDLGILVSGFGGFGPRVIQEAEAAQAMKIVDEAGIDITKKAIWRDRGKIVKGLDEDMKEWVQDRAKK